MDLINSLLFSDKTPKLIKKSLDFNTRKASVITANIANSETPAYKAVNLKFEEMLQDAATGNRLPMKTTNPKHIASGVQDLQRMEPIVEVDSSPGRMDGNNVNMEKEVTSLAQTQLAYEAAITAMSSRGAMVKSAVTESK